VLTQAGDARRQQHLPQGRRRPWVLGRPLDASPVPVPGDRHQPLAGQDPVRSLPDELPLGCGAHAPPQLTGRPPLLGQLEVLAADPAATVLGLLARHRSDDPCGEPPLGRREVVVAARHHRNADAAALHEVDEGLQLAGRAMEPVVVPRHNGVEHVVLDRRKHLLVGPPLLAAVRRAVVVFEVVGDLPAASSTQSLAIHALALDAGALALWVPRDTGVDAGSHDRRGLVGSGMHQPTS